ncbi:biopolymer transporter ExbD [Marivita sp. S6314]|uniref:ExbD/TolR family protein n=1 Tax=Marivita sp. S6314 TaxID=2926406 RepID=UPI001FF46BFC|nr:biopolymer transporter ExbD [Marivita sp. S6314]MCK0149077.1 biopolymer transporter ExbD [Marivita sp. S6314]
MLDLRRSVKRRRIGLTPMIDVVFLLLVFFMLAARFGATDAIPITLSAGGPSGYEGPPRLLTVSPDALRVNGIDTPDAVAALAELMPSDDAVIVLRPADSASVQRLLDVMSQLRAAGWTNLVVLE